MMLHSLILATDLDGTFLEGAFRLNGFFYDKLTELREQVLLIYVTGRPVLPRPHFV
jgi:hydroxymethylpyrimidine pyrophosphatase-like HAD family hydrolase